MTELVVARPEGLYCPPGDFYIDPWRPVERAVLTHAHADHARPGSGQYLAAVPGAGLLRRRLGDIRLDTLPYGERLRHRGVSIGLYPAGHVLGSAQVRLEYRGEVWVVSGDYKREADPTCAPFEPLRCHTFITESTFGLPIYRWRDPARVFAGIDDWWRDNAAAGRQSLLFCYALGKAQRLLAGVDGGIGPVLGHGAVLAVNDIYREAGVALPPCAPLPPGGRPPPGALVLAPLSARGTPWVRRFGNHSDAFASGWMLIRGARRRRGVDRGFVLSDHADWPALLATIADTGASRVIVTHGQVEPLVRWLGEQGLEAGAFATDYGDEDEPAGTEAP